MYASEQLAHELLFLCAACIVNVSPTIAAHQSITRLSQCARWVTSAAEAANVAVLPLDVVQQLFRFGFSRLRQVDGRRRTTMTSFLLTTVIDVFAILLTVTHLTAELAAISGKSAVLHESGLVNS